MIKKILLTLGLIGFGLISFANGQFIERGETIFINDSPSSNTFVSILNGLTDDGNFYNKGIVSLWHNEFGNYSHQLFFHDNKIYFNHSLAYNTFNAQGYITNWKICSLDENNYNNPSAVNCPGNYYKPINLSDINQVDSIFLSYWIINNVDIPSSVCFIDKSQKKSFCVSCHSRNCPSGYTPGNLFDGNNYYDENAVYELGEDIFNGGGAGGDDLSDGGVELGSSESAILYFESKYGWDQSICYAGIDNLTAVYGDPVSFQEGQGLNIFQVFSGLYGNSDLDKVYVWLNSWLINYDQWYERSEPLYLSNYNSGSNQVDLYYTGFTFPFANNPVAIYFLTDNIYNRSEYKTQGSEIVSYCNLKINNGTFEEIIDQSVKENINNNTQLVNINKGLNPDGSRREFDNIGAFLTSGTDLAFSGNTTIKNTLKNFFEDMDQSLSLLDINSSNRILPSWLVTAFLFVVLFKLFRKR